ncbi:MAG: histidine phosphatase family protein [Chloroflexota bacterium]|nr:MAG: histidine phosphatase family protein [Chloroflexota bacterium]
MHLYLIRHGQSVNNLIWTETQSDKGRSYDPELTATGRAQAHRVAEFLRDELDARLPLNGSHPEAARPKMLYTSLMTRAVETGHVIARTLNVPLVALTDAFESGGLYNTIEETGERLGVAGPNRAHFEKHYPNLALPTDVGEIGWYNRPAEPREERPERARRVWNDLLARHAASDDTIGLITHGGFYNHLLAIILQLPEPRKVWFALNNCAVSRIDLREEEIIFPYLNRFDFLPPNLITL